MKLLALEACTHSFTPKFTQLSPAVDWTCPMPNILLPHWSTQANKMGQYLQRVKIYRRGFKNHRNMKQNETCAEKGKLSVVEALTEI